MFNYDWFYGAPYQQQRDHAGERCIAKRFPEVKRDQWDNNAEVCQFRDDLVLRTLLYLRDGYSYEVKEFIDLTNKSHLVFECEPVEEHYKVSAFVVTLPFEEIVRVEVFAVHANEKPGDWPQITGFRHNTDAAESSSRMQAQPSDS